MAKISANATVPTTGATGSISASVAPVRGALGYAWFWGAAGAETLGAITTINSVVISAPATGSQTAVSLGANDNSANLLAFDGLIYQAVKAGSGASVYTMASGVAGVGSPLTRMDQGASWRSTPF